MTTFDKQETALYLADGDFWNSVSADQTTDQLDTQLGNLYDAADLELDPTKLMGTMPDDTIVCIGTSPRRPRLA
jgi:hypothetical protein